jgi:hypothetical protein
MISIEDKLCILSKVYIHLVSQTTRCVDLDGNCLYRGDQGTKCAIGCLIPDDVYKPEMENLGVMDVLRKFPGVTTLFLGIDIESKDILFLSVLQDLHDNDSKFRNLSDNVDKLRESIQQGLYN